MTVNNAVQDKRSNRTVELKIRAFTNPVVNFQRPKVMNELDHLPCLLRSHPVS